MNWILIDCKQKILWIKLSRNKDSLNLKKNVAFKRRKLQNLRMNSWDWEIIRSTWKTFISIKTILELLMPNIQSLVVCNLFAIVIILIIWRIKANIKCQRVLGNNRSISMKRNLTESRKTIICLRQTLALFNRFKNTKLSSKIGNKYCKLSTLFCKTL
jgi:hypothetical protein